MDNSQNLVPVGGALTPAPSSRGGYSHGYYASPRPDDASPNFLLEYWRILRRRKGTLILIASAVTLLAVLVTLPQTPIYRAKTTIEVQDMNQDFLNMKQVTVVNETGPASGVSDIQTQILILQSASLSSRVTAKLSKGLPGPASQPGRVSAWRRALNLPEPPAGQVRNQALAMAAASASVSQNRETRIVSISSDSTDASIAAAYANTLASEYIESNMEARWHATQKTGEWLQRQLEDMRIKLERSEDSLQQYARRAGLMFTSSGEKDKTSVSEERLRQVQTEFGRVQADRVGRQSRYELARAARPEILPDVLNDGNLRTYQTNITELRRQAAELGTVYQADHPKLLRIQAQIDTLEAAFQRERGAILDRIRHEYEEAARHEKLLAADYAGAVQVVTQQAETSIQYNIFRREVETNRQLYDAMLQRVKEAGITSAMKASNIRIVDPAVPPVLPYKPNLRQNAALGLVIGLFLGVGFIVMSERADRTLQEPGDVAQYLDVPELGVVPSANARFRRPFYYYRPRRKQLAPPSVTRDAGAQSPDRIELITWQHKPSGIAESFRSLLTSILFSGRNGDRPKVIVLTSSSPSEGKTTVASNLGIALAEIGHRVLLIDGDMRKPRLHDLFNVSNSEGLRTLLESRQAGLPAELPLQETKVPRLFLLPAGPATAAATNLLYSRNLADLLKRVRAEFDTVLIDSPPMLQMSDARVIGRLSDTVILVARAGKTTRDDAMALCQRLTDDSTPILGVVLNYWEPMANRRYGYKGYYYAEGYSHYYQRQESS